METPKLEKLERPKVVQSTTTRIETGCGHLYVTVGKSDGNIIEVFATLGKAGGCAKAQGEAITRAVSLGLKYGIPVEEFIKELENIRCPSPAWDNGEQVLSCADAIARVLKKESDKEEQQNAIS